MVKYFFKNKLFLVFVVILAGMAALLNVGIALLLKLIADTILNSNLDTMLWIAGLTVLYIVLVGVFDFLAHFFRVKLCKIISYSLKKDIIWAILNKSVLHKEEKAYSDYQSLLLNDVISLEQNYFNVILSCLYQAFNLIFSFLSVLYIQPLFLPVILLICIPPALFTKLTQNKLENLQKNKSEARSFFIKKLTDILHGFRTIKMYNAEKNIEKEADEANYNYAQADIKLAKSENLIMSSAFGVGLLIILSTWVSGAFFIKLELLTFSGIVALTKVAESIAGPFQIIGENYARFMSSLSIRKDIVSILKLSGNIAPHKDFTEITISDCTIVKENKECLHIDAISLKAGDRILVTGASGAGKSTLLNVLAGFEKTKSKLYIDGVLQDENGNLSESVFMQEQKTHIFDAHVIDNITLFDKTKNDEAKKAIEKLNIANLEEKLENQKKFSGGEERRIDFARLLIKSLHKKIVLLDEPFSGLDAENTSNMTEIINSLNPEILVITQHEKLHNSELNYNRIIKIDNGRVEREI